jgi:outer membrane protein assembly factor BamB
MIERDIEKSNEVLLRYWLFCVDLRTGSIDWKRELYSGHPPGGRHRMGSFASETPVTDGTAVYVYIGSLGLWAFDLDGRLLWSEKLNAFPTWEECGTGALTSRTKIR